MATIAPNVDIRENDKEIVLEAELAGIDEKNVEVIVCDGVRTPSAIGADDDARRFGVSTWAAAPMPDLGAKRLSFFCSALGRFWPTAAQNLYGGCPNLAKADTASPRSQGTLRPLTKVKTFEF